MDADSDKPAPRTATPKRFAEILRDYGPAFTLCAILVASYWSYKALAVSASTSRAYLYIRDVGFVVPGGKDTSSEVGAVIVNAGQRAAHILKLRMKLLPAGANGPKPVINENSTEDVEETIDHTHPLTIGVDIPPEVLNLLPPNSNERASSLHEVLKARGQLLFFVGKIQYEDGLDVQWSEWCKYLGAGAEWRTCPPHRAR